MARIRAVFFDRFFTLLSRRWRYRLIATLAALLCILTSPTGLIALVMAVPTLPPQTMEQQARSLYQSQQWEAAAIAFEQAAQGYEQQGDTLRQALSLSNRSLSAQQLGLWEMAIESINASLSLLSQIGNPPAALAQVLDIQARLQLSQGQSTEALSTWERTTTLYQQIGDRVRTQATQINQAQALQTLGLYRRAIALLSSILDTPVDSTPAELAAALPTLPTVTTIAALQSLGEALRVTGDFARSRIVLQHGLAQAEQLQVTEAIAAMQFRLANLTRTEAVAALNRNNMSIAEAVDLIRQREAGRRIRNRTEIAAQFDEQIQTAITLYEQAAAGETETRPKAQLNLLSLLVDLERWSAVQAQLPTVQQQIDRLPASQTAIYASIFFAQTLNQATGLEPGLRSQAVQLLTAEVDQARSIGDPRAESYALGTLGGIYEQNQQWQTAQALTEQALLIAQSIQAADIAYRWQWQLGRLLKQQGDETGAIAAYREAVTTLQSIRQDLIAVSPEEQFSFRDTIEPIHRELVTLLLATDEPEGKNLEVARDVIESLQLAELDNFFREACLNADSSQVDRVDRQAAIFYPIVLPDQIAVILSLPQSETDERSLRYFTSPIAQSTVQNTVDDLRNALDQSNNNRYLPLAQQIYDWLIRPAQADLAATQVQTLVFVLDGVLRNIPIAALHDGNKFVAEQYGLAITPGLQLLETQSIAQTPLSALVAGLSVSRPGFSELPNVLSEVEQIEAELPSSEVLFDQTFTLENLEIEIQTAPFPIVHLATHGKFSSQLEDTFLLTYDGQLDISQLRNLLQARSLEREEPLELLVLSACETAEGDDRATLGLAGMAVRAGARSTIATLWQVSDASSTLLMSRFYDELTQPGATKAVALQKAQQALLATPQYQHPFYWSPYVLIGNWL